MSTAPELLGIKRTTFERVDVSTIKNYIDVFYQETRHAIRYLLLFREDYAALCREVDRLGASVRTTRRNGSSSPVVQLFGVHIAPSPDIPHEPEYALVRLLCEYLEYPLPRLKEREVVVLFEERHLALDNGTQVPRFLGFCAWCGKII